MMEHNLSGAFTVTVDVDKLAHLLSVEVTRRVVDHITAHATEIVSGLGVPAQRAPSGAGADKYDREPDPAGTSGAGRRGQPGSPTRQPGLGYQAGEVVDGMIVEAER